MAEMRARSGKLQVSPLRLRKQREDFGREDRFGVAKAALKIFG
jgi:hypothetical protein